MKKLILLSLALVLVLSAFYGCGGTTDGKAVGTESSSATDGITDGTESGSTTDGIPDGTESGSREITKIIDIITLEDAFNLKGAEEITSGFYGNKYAYGFSFNGAYFRAVATMPDDISEQYYAVDFSQENAMEECKKLICSLEVDSVDNLSEMKLSDDEIKTWIGKTGEDLLENGWSFFVYNFAEMEFEGSYGLLSYKVTFDGEVELPEEYDSDELLKPLTVKSIEFVSIGDVTADFDQ